MNLLLESDWRDKMLTWYKKTSKKYAFKFHLFHHLNNCKLQISTKFSNILIFFFNIFRKLKTYKDIYVSEGMHLCIYTNIQQEVEILR